MWDSIFFSIVESYDYLVAMLIIASCIASPLDYTPKSSYYKRHIVLRGKGLIISYVKLRNLYVISMSSSLTQTVTFYVIEMFILPISKCVLLCRSHSKEHNMQKFGSELGMWMMTTIEGSIIFFQTKLPIICSCDFNIFFPMAVWTLYFKNILGTTMATDNAIWWFPNEWPL